MTTGTVTSARLLGASPAAGRARHQFVPVDRPRLCPTLPRPLAARPRDLGRIRAVAQSRRSRPIAPASPMLLLNGRMSQRSFRALAAVAGADRPAARRCFALCLAQDEVQAERFRRARRRRRDQRRRPQSRGRAACRAMPASSRALRRAIGDRPLWLAASTHAGEEEIAAAVHRGLQRDHPGLLTIIAPRHPARAAEIADDAARPRPQRRPALARRRDRRRRPTSISPTRWASSGLFYRLAGIAFIGGSLVADGRPQPARSGAARLRDPARPDMSNCAAMARSARRCRRGASRSATRRASPPPSRRLLADPVERGGARRAPRAGVAATTGRARRACSPYASLLAVARRARATAVDAARAAGLTAMRAPEFWARAGLVSGLLAPLGWAYGAAGAARRAMTQPYARRVPVDLRRQSHRRRRRQDAGRR